MFGAVNRNEEKLGISANHAQGTDGFHACPLRIREGLAEKTNDVFAGPDMAETNGLAGSLHTRCNDASSLQAGRRRKATDSAFRFRFWRTLSPGERCRQRPLNAIRARRKGRAAPEGIRRGRGGAPLLFRPTNKRGLSPRRTHRQKSLHAHESLRGDIR